MAEISTKNSVVLNVPIEHAWTLLSDHRLDPAWRRGVRRMVPSPDGPVHTGAHTEEELRILGRTVISDVLIEHVVPGRSFTWRVIAGSDANGVRELAPLDAGRCILTTVKQVRLTGGDRWLAPLISRVITQSERGDARRAATFVLDSGPDGRL